jgi:hypothetical protein
MSLHWQKIVRLSLIGGACLLAGWQATTSAKEESSVLVSKPAAVATETQTGPELPPPANPSQQPAATPQPGAPVTSPANRAANSPAELPAPVPPQTSSSTVKRPFLRPAEPRQTVTGKLVSEEVIPPPPGTATATPAPAADGVPVQPTPPIEYDTDRDARRMYRAGKFDLVVLTKDPTRNCAYEIPLTVPSCCVGDPKVSSGRGIFGRGVVEYRWACGFRAIVKFRHIMGNVKVEYEGD